MTSTQKNKKQKNKKKKHIFKNLSFIDHYTYITKYETPLPYLSLRDL